MLEMGISNVINFSLVSKLDQIPVTMVNFYSKDKMKGDAQPPQPAAKEPETEI